MTPLDKQSEGGLLIVLTVKLEPQSLRIEALKGSANQKYIGIDVERFKAQKPVCALMPLSHGSDYDRCSLLDVHHLTAFFFAAALRFAQLFAIAIDIFDLKSASSLGAMASAIAALADFFLPCPASFPISLMSAQRFR